MLKPKVQLNLRNAREYFREHLTVGDYYAGQRIAGEWCGLGAAQLGLTGEVTEAAFLALCHGRQPDGSKLTLRQNTTRRDADRTTANRRLFYDFTISPPKSVSLVALYQDARIIAVHQRAVRTMLTELERCAETRVRKAGADAERVTGNLVAACFRHDTSRELDPHLHTHCVVFNATFDPVEQRWKALHNGGMYRAQKFAENLYYHELAQGLHALGYAITNTRTGFEIQGVPADVIARFSKRHAQIDAETQRQLAAGFAGNVAALREHIAHDKRRRKQCESTAERLRGHWASQLQRSEAHALATLRSPVAPRPADPADDAAAALAWADEHLFERRAVVHEHELLSTALAHARGADFDLPALRQALAARAYLRETGTTRLTSREVLRTELEIVVAAHDGRNRHAPLAPAFVPADALSAEQRIAVNQILGSRDFLTLFTGGAGTGKSRTLQEVARGLASAGHLIVVLAPQRQQVHDLQRDGLPAATLARFLTAPSLPPRAVVLLDEAGQVGGRDLAHLLRLVRAAEGRLILSGDTRQHGAVAVSDALRAIEQHAGLRPAVVRRIQRQDPAWGRDAAERAFIRGYRAAVRAAALGDLAGSFARLEALGCLRACAEPDRRATLAAEYLAARQRGENVLVVAPTRAEVALTNDAIRTRLEAAGQLGPATTLATFAPVDLSAAEKRDPRAYTAGRAVYFLQRYGRYRRGDLCEIVGVSERGVVLLKNDRRATLSFRYANRFVVAERTDLALAPGDRLQLKFNGTSREGRPLANGELVTVQRVRRNGAVVVRGDDGRRKTLSATQRLLTRGYAVTSYASQGKTVDTVLLADAAASAATNAKQWYVTISRARRRVLLFSSDPAALRENIQRLGERALALDLATPIVPAIRGADWRRRAWEAVNRNHRHETVVANCRAAPRHRLAV